MTTKTNIHKQALDLASDEGFARPKTLRSVRDLDGLSSNGKRASFLRSHSSLVLVSVVAALMSFSSASQALSFDAIFKQSQDNESAPQQSQVAFSEASSQESAQVRGSDLRAQDLNANKADGLSNSVSSNSKYMPDLTNVPDEARAAIKKFATNDETDTDSAVKAAKSRAASDLKRPDTGNGNGIYIGYVNDERLADFARFHLYPLSYGQEYIGTVELRDYVSSWADYVTKLKADAKDVKGNKVKCTLSSSSRVFSAIGSDCLDIPGFERLDAQANSNGVLASMIVHVTMEEDTPKDAILKFLDRRFTEVDPYTTPMAEEAKLSRDLCSVMEELSEKTFKCQYSFFNAPKKDTYIKAYFVEQYDKEFMTISYSSIDYIMSEELPRTKRRLAIMRAELSRQGKQDVSMGTLENN